MIIESVEKKVHGEVETVFDYLKQFNVGKDEGDRLKLSYGSSIRRATIEKIWANNGPLEAIEEVFLEQFQITARLGGANVRDDPVEKAADKIYFDEEIELKISKIFKRAFGKDVILHRERSGGVFKIGSRSKVPPHQNRLTPDYRKLINGLQDVFAQGAGIRSFARIAIQLFVSQKSVFIIDEPELFLHPPQAKQMARLIAYDFDADRQFVIATHNETFLKNILDFGKERVIVVRLDRKIEKTHAKILNNQMISELWEDPLLRTSNIISSLFHDAVVLCEGETDVRFLESMMDAMYGQENLPDTAYFSCNGKAKIKSVLKAISNVSIPVVVCVDFDIINSRHDLLKIYELNGGKSQDISEDLNLVHCEVNADRFSPKLKTVKSQVTEAFDKLDPEKPVPSDTLFKIRDIIDHGSPWAQLKLLGLDGIQNVKARAAAKRIVDTCMNHGIIINDFGELESLCRDVDTNKKSDWLSAVLSKDLKNDPALEKGRHIAVAIKAKLPRVRK